jgi:hypothetical protein
MEKLIEQVREVHAASATRGGITGGTDLAIAALAASRCPCRLKRVPSSSGERHPARMNRRWGAVPMLIGITLLLAACSAPTPSQSAVPRSDVAIAIPSCGPDDDCAQGFTVDDRYYFIVCTNVRPEAVDDFPVGAGAGEFSEVRRIPGLPLELFLAVMGDIDCGPGGSWWLAQTDDAVDELNPPLRDRLADVPTP